MSILKYVSATQITMFERCPRSWFMSYRMGIKQPPSKAMLFGSAVHAAIEKYLLTGSIKHLGDCPRRVRALVVVAINNDVLPPPELLPSTRLLIEQSLSGLTLAGVPVRGFIDLAVDYAPALEVTDHKTTSAWKWAKTAPQMQHNTQLILYAAYMFARQPDAVVCRVAHNQLLTKGAPDARRVTAQISRQWVNTQLGRLDAIVASMIALAEANDPAQAQQKLTACGMFGGCYLRSQCYALGNPNTTQQNNPFGPTQDTQKMPQNPALKALLARAAARKANTAPKPSTDPVVYNTGAAPALEPRPVRQPVPQRERVVANVPWDKAEAFFADEPGASMDDFADYCDLEHWRADKMLNTWVEAGLLTPGVGIDGAGYSVAPKLEPIVASPKTAPVAVVIAPALIEPATIKGAVFAAPQVNPPDSVPIDPMPALGSEPGPAAPKPTPAPTRKRTTPPPTKAPLNTTPTLGQVAGAVASAKPKGEQALPAQWPTAFEKTFAKLSPVTVADLTKALQAEVRGVTVERVETRLHHFTVTSPRRASIEPRVTFPALWHYIPPAPVDVVGSVEISGIARLEDRALLYGDDSPRIMGTFENATALPSLPWAIDAKLYFAQCRKNESSPNDFAEHFKLSLVDAVALLEGWVKKGVLTLVTVGSHLAGAVYYWQPPPVSGPVADFNAAVKANPPGLGASTPHVLLPLAVRVDTPPGQTHRVVSITSVTVERKISDGNYGTLGATVNMAIAGGATLDDVATMLAKLEGVLTKARDAGKP